jgi:hypothetical protein
MVAVAVRAAAAQVILVVMAPSVGTVGAASPPLVRSCGVADVQKPSVLESNVEEPSCF